MLMHRHHHRRLFSPLKSAADLNRNQFCHWALLVCPCLDLDMFAPSCFPGKLKNEVSEETKLLTHAELTLRSHNAESPETCNSSLCSLLSVCRSRFATDVSEQPEQTAQQAGGCVFVCLQSQSITG